MVLLSESQFCRLCGELNKNGVNIFDNNFKLSEIINKYLPLKVKDDGILPKTICPGCHIHLEDTTLFFDSIIQGQIKLRQLKIEELKSTLSIQCRPSGNFVEKIEMCGCSPGNEVSMEPCLVPTTDNMYDTKGMGLQIFDDSKDLLNFDTEVLINETANREGSLPVEDYSMIQAEVLDKSSTKSVNIVDASLKEPFEHAGISELLPEVSNSQISAAEISIIDTSNGLFILKGNDSITQTSLSVNDSHAEVHVDNLVETDLQPVNNLTALSIPVGDLIQSDIHVNNLSLSDVNVDNLTPMDVPTVTDLSNSVVESLIHSDTPVEHLTSVIMPTSSDAVAAEVPVKRKRGRPTREESLKNTKYVMPTVLARGPRSVRIRKPPARFDTEIQGKELENALKEAGAIQEDEIQVIETTSPVSNNDTNEITYQLIGRMMTLSKKYLGQVLRLPKSTHSQLVIRCDACQNKFTRINLFMNHKLQGQCGLFECPECYECFTNTEEFNSHKDICSHSKQLPWLCHACDVVSNSLESLKEHMKTAHKMEKCPFCLRKFFLRRNLESHVNKLHSKKKIVYGCQHCSQKFNCFSSVLYHEDTEHRSYLYQCTKCNRFYSNRQLLQKHQAVHIQGGYMYGCHLCPRMCKTSCSLKSHIQTHSKENNFTCDICLSVFKFKKSLQSHINIHFGGKLFQCPVCSKSFSSKGNFKVHLRVHSGERPYVCDICQSTFKTSSHLNCHKKLHTGEHPYPCFLCPKKFIFKEAHEVHKRRHQGIKPFPCKVCAKSFVDLATLKKHIRIHTGEKPFSCKLCEKSFTDCSNLKKHVKKVHEARTETLYLDLNEITTDQLTDLRLDDLGVNEEGDSLCLAISTTQSQIQEIKELNGLEDATKKIVTDEMGIPLKVTLADGSQLQVTTMDGESLQVTTLDGVSIPVKLNVEGLDQLPAMESLQPPVDVSNTLTELTNIGTGDDYIHFITDEGQDIRILPGSFSVPTLKWDLPS